VPVVVIARIRLRKNAGIAYPGEVMGLTRMRTMRSDEMERRADEPMATRRGVRGSEEI
jgi:hypothetical protein